MTDVLHRSSVVARGQGWLSAWVGDEHVMMSADTGTCISLSETGGRIWELLEQPTTLQSLYESLAQEYNVEPATMEADVLPFLMALREQHALNVQ